MIQYDDTTNGTEEYAAAERAAAERAAAERAAAYCWTLSDREREIVDGLGDRGAS